MSSNPLRLTGNFAGVLNTTAGKTPVPVKRSATSQLNCRQWKTPSPPPMLKLLRRPNLRSNNERFRPSAPNTRPPKPWTSKSLSWRNQTRVMIKFNFARHASSLWRRRSGPLTRQLRVRMSGCATLSSLPRSTEQDGNLERPRHGRICAIAIALLV